MDVMNVIHAMKVRELDISTELLHIVISIVRESRMVIGQNAEDVKMKIIKVQTKPKPKCNGCNSWHIFVHCNTVMINGCDTYWCLFCWQDHSNEHQKWNEMAEIDKNRIIQKYGG